jgi:hypothetical protein
LVAQCHHLGTVTNPFVGLKLCFQVGVQAAGCGNRLITNSGAWMNREKIESIRRSLLAAGYSHHPADPGSDNQDRSLFQKRIDHTNQFGSGHFFVNITEYDWSKLELNHTPELSNLLDRVAYEIELYCESHLGVHKYTFYGFEYDRLVDNLPHYEAHLSSLFDFLGATPKS